MIDAMARAMVQQTYMEGDLIARVGDPVQEMYFVTHGEVKASDEDEDEEHLGPGECFGEECILIEMKRLHDDEETTTRFSVLEVDHRRNRPQEATDPADLSRSGLATTDYSVTNPPSPESDTKLKSRKHQRKTYRRKHTHTHARTHTHAQTHTRAQMHT
jgi:hypothetical protein